MLYIGVYYKNKEKDFFLPQNETWVSSLLLENDGTGLHQSLLIPIRALQHQWYLGLPDGFFWMDAVQGERPVSAGHYLMSNNQERVSLVISEWKNDEMAFRIYKFPSANKITIGRENQNNIFVNNPMTTASHGILERLHNIATYTDKSSNGTYLNGKRCQNTSVMLRYGDILLVPPELKLIYLGDYVAVNHPNCLSSIDLDKASFTGESIEDESESTGLIEYHRSPRMLQMPDTSQIEVEAPLSKQEPPNQPLWLKLGPSMTMVLPMLMGTLAMSQSGSGFMAGGLVMISTSAALGTMWGLVNHRYQNRHAEKTERRRIALYKKYLAEVETQLKTRASVEFHRLNQNHISSEDCVLFPKDPNARMWERMPTHDDFLFIRIGIGEATVPGEIKVQPQKLSMIDDPLRNEPQKLKAKYGHVDNAPVCINLRQQQMVGLLGCENARSLARSIVVQLAALHSYNDIKICILTDETEYAQWRWASWLPHVYATVDRDLRMCVCKPSAISEVLNNVYEVLGERIERQSEEKRNDTEEEHCTSQPLPHYVILCTNPTLLDGQRIMHHLLSGYYGMTLMLIAPSMEMLPKECNLIIAPEGSNQGIFDARGSVERLSFQMLPRKQAECFARLIAPIRVNDLVEQAAIPSYVTFLESYHARTVEQLDVWRYWNENATYEGLRSVIGLKAGGEPFILDISERMHGPHGLVAGTTGSGKSVMLQTYILSLAVNYSPKQIQFALIDYKGGGMASAFQTLPHVAGIINDIQGAQDITRALASVQGEIERRKRVLADTNTENVDEYNHTFHDSHPGTVIPHLIIVVDEFAELRRENPEFMKELITAARVGRSLGIHLILATQKPSNSVDDEIWSNTRFRLCLRVASRSDSNDMLKRPDAAYLKGMGRCYVQVGSDELFEQVQTCFSGAIYAPDAVGPEQMPRMLNEVGKPITLKTVKKQKVRERTQMDAVLERICEVASANGITPATRMWKNRLDSILFLQVLEDFVSFDGSRWYGSSTDDVSVEIGYADDVNRQLYIPFITDLTKNRNYLFIGMPQSGKTTALQTIAIALCEKYSPEDIQLYIFSLSSKTLGSLADLPHVGGVVYEDEPQEQLRLLNMLKRENARRKQIMSRAATDSYLEYQRATQLDSTLPQVPAMVIMIDRLFQARELFDDESFEQLSVLICEGSSRGMFFVVTALAIAEIPWKLQASFHPVALENASRSDYSDALSRRIPSELPDILHTPGRCMARMGDQVMEVQLAVFNPASQLMPDVERSAQLQARAEAMSSAWTGAKPKPIPRIPEKPLAKALVRDYELMQPDGSSFMLPLGYHLLEGLPYAVNLWNDFSWMAVGGAQSGKTTLLKTVAWQMGRRGADILVITDRPDEWRGLSLDGTLTVSTADDEASIAYLERLNAQSEDRGKCRNAQEDEAGRKQAILSFTPMVILLDNLDRIGSSMPQSAAFLAATCTRAMHFGVYLIAAASSTGAYSNQSQPLMRAFIQREFAIALRGKLSDCDLFPCQLNYTQKSVLLPMGHAYVVSQGEAHGLILPEFELA